jgi:hypothetical protein
LGKVTEAATFPDQLLIPALISVITSATGIAVHSHTLLSKLTSGLILRFGLRKQGGGRYRWCIVAVVVEARRGRPPCLDCGAVYNVDGVSESKGGEFEGRCCTMNGIGRITPHTWAFHEAAASEKVIVLVTRDIMFKISLCRSTTNAIDYCTTLKL